MVIILKIAGFEKQEIVSTKHFYHEKERHIWRKKRAFQYETPA